MENNSNTPDLTIDIYRPIACENIGSTESTEGSDGDGTKVRIKSSAVSVHSTVSVPPKLFLLRSNTDLKTTPSNWFSLGPRDLGAPKPLLRHGPFTSFRMASSFLDSVGEVDVVSDAENIKKLLKIPYSKSSVSMMVHRVGNTLLLDEFDIHTHLLRAAENEWGWLKKFYMDHVFASLRSKAGNSGGSGDGATSASQFGGRHRKPTRHSRDYLQQQNLISKFLHHSLALSDSASVETFQVDRDLVNGGREDSKNQQVQPINSDPLDGVEGPNQTDSSPLPGQPFSKNIIWTFEDLRMLIGTDLPIFGGGTHPCLSLRLRDMSKPINVLTGLDYWLDNLMCNVPEVVMCYHLDGLVQKYELIKTDDLPRLPNSQFKPGIIKDVAQNILSFLKSKATKAGHTYWLFKGKDEDVVKLYDLTSLCSDLNEDVNQNPFTTPVAMLLFKVARNLKMSSDYKRHQGTVLELLKNCLAILDSAKYPQVATAACYYLSDVYVPSSFKSSQSEPAEDPFADENWDYKWEDESEMEDQFSASVEVKALSTPQQVQALQSEAAQASGKNGRPVAESLEQRCSFALQYAVRGLECIVEKKLPSKPVHDEPTQASPFKPIPMPYSTLNSTENKNQIQTSINGSLMSKEPLLDEWKRQYWRLLVEKCALVHVIIADTKADGIRNKTQDSNEPSSVPNVAADCVAECFAHLNLAARLWNYLDVPGRSLQSYALTLAGEIYFSLVQRWRSEFVTLPSPSLDLDPINQQLLQLLDDVKATRPETVHFPSPSSLQEALQLSMDSYRDALANFSSPECGSESDGACLAKRLGNTCNEMGVFYMSKAANVIEEGGEDWSRCFIQLFHSSRQHLEEGVEVFRRIEDSANVALLSCNLAKLYRVQARALAPAEKKEVSLAEWKCYSKALQCYKQALDVLVHRELHTSIWDAVVWDYTSVLFTLASLLQDFAPLSLKSREEVENEIIRLLETCIAYSRGDTSPSRVPLLQYRAATCHYRLASLHHDTYRNGEGESIINGRNVRIEAEAHYSNACELFEQLEHWDEVIRLLLEKAGIYEFQLKRLTGTSSKIRTLQSILNCYLSTAPALSTLIQSVNGSDAIESKTSNCLALMGPRLQSSLLQLAKLTKTSKNLSSSNLAEMYRSMYSKALQLNVKETDWPVQLSRIITELEVAQKGFDEK